MEGQAQEWKRRDPCGGPGRLRAMSTQPPALDATIARLAREHDAPTLAAALVARLHAEGRTELEAAIGALFPALTIDPNPPHPGEQP